MQKIILASKSPRRRKLLEQIGIKFVVEESNVDEENSYHLSPRDMVKHLSIEKAKAVARKNKQAIVIGADTTVILENEVIGKPRSEKEAKEILKKLSNKTHLVITGITIINFKKILTRLAETKVHFRKLTDKEINAYVKTGEPMDKAGGYGVQEKAGIFIDNIQGDYFNVVGLPISAVSEMLKEFGIDIPKFWK